MLVFQSPAAAINVSPVVLSQTTLALEVGGSATFGVSQPGNTQFQVTTSSPNASVVLANGVATVTALEVGTIVITIEGANQQSSTATLTVTPSPMTLSVATLPLLQIGQTTTFTAIQPGNSLNNFTVAVDVPDVQVSIANGVVTVTGLVQGQATITVTGMDSQTASITATVVVYPLMLSSNALSGPQGGTGTVLAAQPNNSTFTAFTDTPSVAMVSVSGSTIYINYISTGTANILVQGAGGQTQTLVITVTVLYQVAPVVVLPNNLYVVVGVVGYFAASQEDGNTTFTANSDTPGVATILSVVGPLIEVQSVAPGLANITVVGNDGQSDIVTFSVAKAAYVTPQDTLASTQAALAIAIANFYALYGNQNRPGYTVYFTPSGGWAIAPTGTEYLGLVASFLDLTTGYASLEAFQNAVLANF